MQPVTIKNNQLIHTIVMLQTILLILLVVSLMMAWGLTALFLGLSFCLCVGLYYFHLHLNKSIVDSLKSTGKGFYVKFQDGLRSEAVLVSDYWQLPGVVFLKLNEIESAKIIYLTCLRSKLGGDTYVSLLTHIIQPESKVELK